MEEMIAKLVEKVGLSEDQAKKVADFVAEHVDDIPGWVAKAGLAKSVPGLDKLF